MNKVILVIIGIFYLTIAKSYGQADISMSTHWYNRANYNPASISRPGYIYFFSNIRRQWLGINGSPTVYNIQASGFSEEHNSAFGISLIRDDIGLSSVINPSLSYAYRVTLKGDLFLSLGLSFGLYSRSVNSSAYEAEIIFDPALDYSDQRFSSPDANFGLELQKKHWILGMSLTHLFSIWKAEDLFLVTNHQYAYLIYKNSESELYNLTTGLQVINRNNLTVVEGTAIVRLKKPTGLIKGPTEILDVGVTYRSVRQLTFLTGFNITPDIRIGYTYDFDFSYSSNKSGTHEFLIEYRIPLKTKKDTGLDWYY